MALMLEHPNVVKTFARVVDGEGQLVGMASEFLHGEDLQAALRYTHLNHPQVIFHLR